MWLAIIPHNKEMDSRIRTNKIGITKDNEVMHNHIGMKFWFVSFKIECSNIFLIKSIVSKVGTNNIITLEMKH